jgi:hypothetical protein
LPLAQLDAFPDDPATVSVAFAESADFVRFLSEDEGRVHFAALSARVRAGEPFDKAVGGAYGVELPSLEARWREDLGRRFVTYPLVIGSVAGWAIAGAIFVVAWRRRKRRNAATLARWAREEALEDARATAMSAAAARADVGKLLVVDEGIGHVVYMVEPPRVPTVQHEGKTHTLH